VVNVGDYSYVSDIFRVHVEGVCHKNDFVAIFYFISKTRVEFPGVKFALDLSLARPAKAGHLPARLPHGFLNKIENYLCVGW
jgi:hypothetical protein